MHGCASPTWEATRVGLLAPPPPLVAAGCACAAVAGRTGACPAADRHALSASRHHGTCALELPANRSQSRATIFACTTCVSDEEAADI